MKNKMLYRSFYRIMALTWLLIGAIVLTGCGKQEASVQTAETKETSEFQVVTDIEEKFVCAMYRLEAEDMDSTIGKIESLDDNGISFTAEYTEDMGSFCFIVNEIGKYQVSIIREDETISEHIVDINDENSYYLLYMKGMIQS